MSDHYLIGSVVRITLVVADLDNAPADPGGLQIKTKSPEGIVTTYLYGVAPEVIRDSLGNYHADISLTSAGQWAYRWELTAPNGGAAEGVLSVQKSYVI